MNLSAPLLGWLRSFDAAAQHNSFTAAANSLHVTQGAVSQQVKQLETWLGVRLFHRNTRNISLSREGMQLKLACQEAFQVLETTLQQIKVQNSSYTINLNCSPSFAMRWFVAHMGTLMREHPDIDLRVYGEFHTLTRDRMEIERIQAAIRYDPGGHRDIFNEVFLDEWLLPVASPQFMRDHPEIDSPENLPSALMLHDASPWEETTEPLVEWDSWLKAAGRQTMPRHDGPCFNLSQLAVSAAMAGQGIAIGRLALVLEDLVSGRLVPAFRLAIPSQASYRFMTLNEKQPRMNTLREWLMREGKRFRQERDLWLATNVMTMREPTP